MRYGQKYNRKEAISNAHDWSELPAEGMPLGGEYQYQKTEQVETFLERYELETSIATTSSPILIELASGRDGANIHDMNPSNLTIRRPETRKSEHAKII
jgi:hypothetical protein